MVDTDPAIGIRAFPSKGIPFDVATSRPNPWHFVSATESALSCLFIRRRLAHPFLYIYIHVGLKRGYTNLCIYRFLSRMFDGEIGREFGMERFE